MTAIKLSYMERKYFEVDIIKTRKNQNSRSEAYSESCKTSQMMLFPNTNKRELKDMDSGKQLFVDQTAITFDIWAIKLNQVDRIVDSALIQKNMGQGKPVFLHIICSDKEGTRKKY